ncbi:hypothetical protein GTC3P0254_49490 [Burkholderia pseudomallei]|nr:hypothetical protein GTC3P0254_49490 [Burkholderia pseudomallei]
MQRPPSAARTGPTPNARARPNAAASRAPAGGARLGDARRVTPYDPPRADRRACTSERNTPLPSDIIGEPPACMPGEK